MIGNRIRFLPKRGLSLLAGLVAGGLAFITPMPAQAALVNDYSMTDDVWGTPIAPGHFLVDGRATFTTPTASSPNALTAPALALAYGAYDNIEIGLWSAYGASGVGSAASAGALAPVCPYVKWQLPVSVASASFGLTAGGQIPTQAGMEHSVALEAAASVPLSNALSLDLGVGGGRNLLQPATLGHGNLAFYYSLPGGQSLLAEAYGYVTGTALSFGEHVGLQAPLTKSLSGDVSIAAGESPSGFQGFTPQLGLTLTL